MKRAQSWFLIIVSIKVVLMVRSVREGLTCPRFGRYDRSGILFVVVLYMKKSATSRELFLIDLRMSGRVRWTTRWRMSQRGDGCSELSCGGQQQQIRTMPPACRWAAMALALAKIHLTNCSTRWNPIFSPHVKHFPSNFLFQAYLTSMYTGNMTNSPSPELREGHKLWNSPTQQPTSTRLTFDQSPQGHQCRFLSLGGGFRGIW